MYRTDLFEKAGLTMPNAPTWDFVVDAAKKLTDKSAGVYGICLRGKAGWGENMAFLTAMANSFGARWFDEKWQPQFKQPEWKTTLTTYVNLMQDAGPPGASSNGFNENLALFNAGKCGMWIDATVAASFVTDPKQSRVADKVGFALAPNDGLGKNANWLWAWNLAIPAGSKKVDAAEKFIAWATSKEYTDLVAAKEGWADVPPGTRKSLYQNPEYQKAAPFAEADARVDRLGRPQPPDGQASALCRRAVRRHSRVPGHRHRRSASSSPRRSPAHVGRRGAGRGAVADRARNEARRLHQVSPRTARTGARVQTAVTKETQARVGRLALSAGRRAAVHLDDRAVGDDDLFLDPALQPAQSRDGSIRRPRQLLLLPDRPGVSLLDAQYPLLVGSVLVITIVLAAR